MGLAFAWCLCRVIHPFTAIINMHAPYHKTAQGIAPLWRYILLSKLLHEYKHVYGHSNTYLLPLLVAPHLGLHPVLYAPAQHGRPPVHQALQLLVAQPQPVLQPCQARGNTLRF